VSKILFLFFNIKASEFFSKVILILSFFIFSMNIYGQTYDNWIKYDQPYFKVEIAEDGIYRINYLDLSL
jgi:hypothetical protein